MKGECGWVKDTPQQERPVAVEAGQVVSHVIGEHRWILVFAGMTAGRSGGPSNRDWRAALVQYGNPT